MIVMNYRKAVILMFKLTDDEAKMLKQYANIYESERKADATAAPIVLVQNRIKRYASSKYSADGREFRIEINGHNLTEDGLAADETEAIDIIKEYLSETDISEEEIAEIVSDIKFKLGYITPSDIVTIDKSVEILIMANYYAYDYQTVAYFFTRCEAKRYIKDQGHNLHSPRVFTAFSGYSNNGDYPVFQKLLKRLGEHLLKEGNNASDL